MKFPADENITSQLIRGLLRRDPELDIIRVQDVGLISVADPIILEWAATHERILITFDIRTVPTFAYARVAQGQSMSGVIVLQ